MTDTKTNRRQPAQLTSRETPCDGVDRDSQLSQMKRKPLTLLFPLKLARQTAGTQGPNLKRQPRNLSWSMMSNQEASHELGLRRLVEATKFPRGEGQDAPHFFGIYAGEYECPPTTFPTTAGRKGFSAATHHPTGGARLPSWAKDLSPLVVRDPVPYVGGPAPWKESLALRLSQRETSSQLRLRVMDAAYRSRKGSRRRVISSPVREEVLLLEGDYEVQGHMRVEWRNQHRPPKVVTPREGRHARHVATQCKLLQSCVDYHHASPQFLGAFVVAFPREERALMLRAISDPGWHSATALILLKRARGYECQGQVQSVGERANKDLQENIAKMREFSKNTSSATSFQRPFSWASHEEAMRALDAGGFPTTSDPSTVGEIGAVMEFIAKMAQTGWSIPTRDLVSLVGIVMSSTWTDALVHLGSLMCGDFFSRLGITVDYLVDCVTRCWDSLLGSPYVEWPSFPQGTRGSSGLNPLGAFDDLYEEQGIADEAKRFIAAFHRSPLTKQLSALVATISAVALFGGEGNVVDRFVKKSVWNLNSVSTCTTGIEQVVNLVVFWQDALEKFKQTGDFMEFFGKSAAEIFITEVVEVTKELQEMRDTVTSRFPDLVNRGRNLVMQSMRFKEPLIASRVSMLSTALETAQGALGGTRVPPVGFILTGTPGTGKTTICSLVSNAMRMKYELPVGVSVSHNVVEANFQKLPPIVSVLIMNDQFDIKDDKTSIPIVKMLQQCVDSSTLYFDGASIEDKANGKIAPDVMLVSTNTKKYKATNSVGGVTKLDHRYDIISCEWTDHAIARSKVEGEEPRFLYPTIGVQDVTSWVRFEVGRMDNNREGENKNVVDFAIKKHFCYLDSPEAVVEYILRKEAKRALTNVAGEYKSCKKCYLPEGHKGECILIHGPVRNPGVREKQGVTVSKGAFQQAEPEQIEDLFAAAKIPMGEAARLLASGRVTLHELRAFSCAGRIALAVGAGSIVVLTALQVLKYFALSQTQGAMVSTVTNMAETSGFVRPMASTAASWLGATGDPVVDLSWDRWVSPTLHGLIVAQTLIAIPKHFFEGAREGETIVMKRGNQVDHIKFQRVLLLETKIDKCFLSVQHLPSVGMNCFARLPPKPCAPAEDCSIFGRGTAKVDNLLQYPLPTKKGDCGLPLTGVSNTIYGFHVGFHTGRLVGNSVPLSQEEVRGVIALFKARGVHVPLQGNGVSEVFGEHLAQCGQGLHPSSDLAWLAKEDDFWKADHVPVAHLKFTDKPNFSAQPSTVHDVFKHGCQAYGKPYAGHAMRLSDGTWSSPVVGRVRSMIHQVDVDATAMNMAVLEYVAGIPATHLEPLTDYAAITGDQNNVLVNPRDNSKSMGPHLALQGVTKRNAFVLNKDGNGYEIHQKVLEAIDERLKHLQSGEPVRPTLVTATLKDEVYPTAKAEKGKARIFYVMDWVDNHIMRRYLLPIMTYLMDIPFLSGVVVTINASGPGWGQLYTFLDEFGQGNVYAGDQTAYDQKHTVMMGYYCRVAEAIAKKCGYSDYDAWMVSQILDGCSRYWMKIGGNWVLCSTGLCSGRSDTIFANCIIMNLMCYYAIITSGVKAKPRDVARISATGDDLLLAIKPQYLDKVTGDHLTKAFSDGGYVMTSADKKTSVQLEPLREAQYLKRNFRFEGTAVYAPLALDSIYRSMAYSVGVPKGGERQRDIDAAGSAVREAFMHGREFFERFCSELRAGFGDEFECPTYERLEEDYALGVISDWSRMKVPANALDPGLYEVQSVVADHSSREASEEKHPNGRGAYRGFPVSTTTVLLRGARDSRYTSSTETTSQLNPTTMESDAPSSQPVLEVRMETDEMVVIPSIDTSVMEYPSQVGLDAFFARPRRIEPIVPGIYQPVFSWLALTSVVKVVGQWQFFRGDMTIEIVYTGSSQNIGKSRAYVYPLPVLSPNGPYEITQTLVGASGANPVTSSQLPHMDLDHSLVGTHKIKLPFPLACDFSHRPNANYYQMTIADINPTIKANGGTPDSVDFSVYVSFENVRLDVLVQQGEYPPGAMERAMGYAKALGQNIPGAYQAPVVLAASIGQSIAQYMGWARPPVEAQEVVVSRNNGNPALASGQPDFSLSLGVDPNALRSVGAGIIPFSAPGESSFKSLVARWTDLVVDWQSGVEAVMVPCHFLPDPDVNIFRATTIGYFAGGFRYWSGDLEVCVEVISSPLIRWRIGINIVPANQASPLEFIEDGSMLGYIIEADGSMCTNVIVPYQHQAPFMHTGFYPPLSADVSQTRLVYWSLNTPTGPSATPVYPYVNLSIRAGPNFTVGTPDLANFQDYEIQSGGGLGALSEANFGEKVDDLLLLTRRSTPYVYLKNTIASASMCLSIEPVDSTPVNVARHKLGWQKWLQAAFLAHSGSTCFKLFSNMPGHILVGTTFASPSVNGGFPPDDATGLVFWLPPEVCEVRVPDRNPYRFTYNGVSGVVPVDVLAISKGNGDLITTSNYVDVWRSAGDDFRVGGYMCTPRMLL